LIFEGARLRAVPEVALFFTQRALARENSAFGFPAARETLVWRAPKSLEFAFQ
jgi:hypothetical protein